MGVVPFVKAHADGNDFLIIAEEHAGDRKAELARALCARHTGIGADGIEWVREVDGGYAIDLTNADGSNAEISGNGTRCVAAWWAQQHSGDVIRLRTGAGDRTCDVLQRNGTSVRVRTEMGRPRLEAMKVTAGGREFPGTFVDLGNPHFVIMDAQIPGDWRETGALLTGNEAFPHGANIEFVRVVSSSEIEFRIYERGVGPTLSSGTGTTASAVAAIVAGAGATLRVRSEGGEQQVEWQGQGPALLTGEAHVIAHGEAWLR